MPIHTILEGLCALGFCKRVAKHKLVTLPSFHREKNLGFSLNSGKETERIAFSAHPLGKQEHYPKSKRGCCSLGDKVCVLATHAKVFPPCVSGTRLLPREEQERPMGETRGLLSSPVLGTLAHKHKTRKESPTLPFSARERNLG